MPSPTEPSGEPVDCVGIDLGGRGGYSGDAALDDTPSDRSSQEELDDVVNDLIFAVQEGRPLPGIATGSTNEESRPEEPRAPPQSGPARQR